MLSDCRSLPVATLQKKRPAALLPTSPARTGCAITMTNDAIARPAVARVGRLGGSMLPVLLAFHLLLWWLVPAFFAWIAPADNSEQLVLSQDLAWSYPKHPPLPTWLLYAAVKVFGASFGLTYLLGAACATAMLAITYRLARDFVDKERAVLVTMISMLVVYHGYLSTIFNHNTVQLPLAAATIALLHFALTRRGWTWWAALGAVAALNFLTKYSALLLLGCCAAYVWAAGHHRRRDVRRGLVLAAAVFAVLVAPHVFDVLSSHQGAVQYADEMISFGSLGPVGRLGTTWNFVWAQVARLAPALIAFGILRFMARRAASASPRVSPLFAEQETFVLLVGWGPLIVTLLLPLVSGARLFTGWGTTFFVLFSLWLLTRPRWAFCPTRDLARRALIVVIVLELLQAALVAWGGGKLPNPLKKLPVAQVAPSDLAQHVRTLWRRFGDAPPCTIATDVATGAALVVQMRGDIPILDHTQSLQRWMEERGCRAQGAIMLLDRPPTEASFATFAAIVREDFGTAEVVETFQVRRRGEDVTYYAGILRPQHGGAVSEPREPRPQDRQYRGRQFKAFGNPL